MSGSATSSPVSMADRRASPLAVALILVTNLIPVAGVLWLGWDAAQILLLYWCENLVIGALTLPRILTARGVDKTPIKVSGASGDRTLSLSAVGTRLFVSGFFIVHYGLFCLVHGVFTLVIVAGFGPDGGQLVDALPAIRARTFDEADFRYAILGIVVLHIVLMLRQWWMSGLWRTSSPGEEMFRPYGRVIVLHFTVLLGGMVLAGLDGPAWSVLILCGVKSVVEIFAERRGGAVLKPLGQGA